MPRVLPRQVPVAGITRAQRPCCLWRPDEDSSTRQAYPGPIPKEPAAFDQLDFLYTPSRDVAGDMRYLCDVLGGRIVFAVEGMGARVAAIELTAGPPLILLTDHVEGDRPILVYRVENLDASLDTLVASGWTREHTFEIPHGPVCSFTTPGGHRIALYQLTRPEAAAHFEGRRDF